MSDIIKAKRYAVNLISRRMYTKSEVYERLIKKGFEKEISQSVTDELEGLGYINDAEYSRLYFEENIKVRAKGVYRISRELMQKGVPREVIDSASEEFEEDVYSSLREYVNLKVRGEMPTEYKEIEKLKAHLVRRGYKISDINRVLSDLRDDY